MRKFYLSLLALTLLSISLISQAQQRLGPVTKQKATGLPELSSNFRTPGTTSDCDTTYLNQAFENWSDYYYTTSYPGYIFGVINYPGFTFKQSGNFFDLSGTSYSYITGAAILFNFANSNVASELNKNVIFHVYDDNGGIPGNEIGSTSLTLGQIKADVQDGNFTVVNFPTPLALPVSQQFYVTVDYSAFKWAGSTRDSLSVGASGDDEDLSIAYQYSQQLGGWYAVSDVWGAAGDPLNVSLWVFPFVSTSEAGCSSLPVKLLSFNAERKSSDVTLSWKISNELNMKQYELERADNNGNFKTVATVKSLNSLKDQSYTVTDKNAFNLAASVQYRLKQVDGDGSVNYSRVVTVKSTAVITDVTFANPFNGSLKLQLNLAASQLVSVSLYDMQGKLVASEKPAMYNASANTIILNSTANLKSGLYVLKLNAGTEQAVYKVVKQ